KRETGESDQVTLIREIKEELDIDIIPSSIQFYGTFRAQAHGRADGVVVQMKCYSAEFEGEIKPSNEIDKVDFFDYSQKNLTSNVDYLIFDDLKKRGFIK